MSTTDLRWRTVGRNMLILLVAVLPGFFVLSWLQARFAGAPGQPVWESIGTGAFFYLAYLLPVAVGGLVHSLALGLTRPAGRRLFEVSIRIGLTVFIPLAVFIAGERMENLQAHAAPLLGCLVLFGLLAKRPSKQPSSAPVNRRASQL